MPNRAELDKKAFEDAERTVSISTLAGLAGAYRLDKDRETHWPFNDGSRLIVKGRGRSHSMRIENGP